MNAIGNGSENIEFVALLTSEGDCEMRALYDYSRLHVLSSKFSSIKSIY